MAELNSSWMASADYDQLTRTLTITTKRGASYEYVDVDPETAQGLQESDSPGRFFASRIKGKLIEAGKTPAPPEPPTGIMARPMGRRR